MTFVTPAAVVAPWADHTLEQARIQTRLIELGVEIIPLHSLAGYADGQLRVACIYTGKPRQLACETLVSVTSRAPNDLLWRDLQAREAEWLEAGIVGVNTIGDCHAPGLIAAAVYAGHAYARETTGQRIALREDRMLAD